jgi:hypothetical protein
MSIAVLLIAGVVDVCNHVFVALDDMVGVLNVAAIFPTICKALF